MEDIILAVRDTPQGSELAKRDLIINDINFSRDFNLIPGPCAIESMDIISDAAAFVVSLGILCMRGGCWKPRTSPYKFQGMGKLALVWAVQACLKHGIKILFIEVVSEESDKEIDRVLAEYDPEHKLIVVRQVGTRNAQNFELLKSLGNKRNPVLLKRGLGNTLEEFLSAAEYILYGGNTRVMLCLRGNRLEGAAPDHRYAQDYRDIQDLREMTWMPIIYDPSHATGKRQYVEEIALEAVKHGAQGLLIDVHPDPSRAQCDAEQALRPHEFADFVKRLREPQAEVAQGAP